MKMTIFPVPQMTLEEFADANNLEMEVHERQLPDGHPARFYAEFKNCEVKQGGCLIGTYGDGATPGEAIANYAPQIALKHLVINAGTPQRMEIIAPKLKAK